MISSSSSARGCSYEFLMASHTGMHDTGTKVSGVSRRMPKTTTFQGRRLDAKAGRLGRAHRSRLRRSTRVYPPLVRKRRKVPLTMLCQLELFTCWKVAYYITSNSNSVSCIYKFIRSRADRHVGVVIVRVQFMKARECLSTRLERQRSLTVVYAT